MARDHQHREPARTPGRLITMKRLLLITLAVFALASSACGSPTISTTATTTTTRPDVSDATPAERVATARLQWADHGLTSYRMITEEQCFCPITGWTDTIVDGVNTSHVATDDDPFFDPGERTMESLFDEIEAAIKSGYASLQLDLDSETGAVGYFWVDVDEMMADEEHGVRVVSLSPHDPTAPPVQISSDGFKVDHPCGYGFAISNVEQTVGLTISYVGSYSDEPDVSGPISVASDQWHAEVIVGLNLFSNWCNDVIDSSDPVPITTQRWPLTSGELIIDTSQSAGCGMGTLTGVLAGATIEPVGSGPITLGDINLTNTAWGCFAG